MPWDPIVLTGLATAAFVGINIGGASTGVAFGPAKGAGVLSDRVAQALMAVFVLAGGILIGPNVVETLGTEFVPGGHFTPAASTAVLLFTGLAILLGNIAKVSTGTSQVMVGSVVGMGAALGVLVWGTVGEVLTWWFVSTVLAFWISAVMARYAFTRMRQIWSAETPRQRKALKGVIIGVGCFMAFSAGASNVANAVAPLVGSGTLPMLEGVILGGVAIGVGAFLLGSRTMETVGEEITELPLEGWVIVMFLAGAIITFLSWIGIPASLALTLQACVMGFGWGRTTRRQSLLRSLGYPQPTPEHRARREQDTAAEYRVDTTRRIVSVWLITPVLAGLLAFLTFLGARLTGLL